MRRRRRTTGRFSRLNGRITCVVLCARVKIEIPKSPVASLTQKCKLCDAHSVHISIYSIIIVLTRIMDFGRTTHCERNPRNLLLPELDFVRLL